MNQRKENFASMAIMWQRLSNTSYSLARDYLNLYIEFGSDMYKRRAISYQKQAASDYKQYQSYMKEVIR